MTWIMNVKPKKMISPYCGWNNGNSNADLLPQFVRYAIMKGRKILLHIQGEFNEIYFKGFYDVYPNGDIVKSRPIKKKLNVKKFGLNVIDVRPVPLLTHPHYVEKGEE